MIRIFRATEFIEWFDQQTEKSKVQIDERLSKIQDEEYFGDHKYVGSGSAEVWELRWKNGRRVYYAYLPESSVFILLGGIKNAQSKDIARAKRLFKKYIE